MKKIGLIILMLCLGIVVFAEEPDNPPNPPKKKYDPCDSTKCIENCNACVMTILNLGNNRPGSMIPSTRLQVFAEDPSPALYTPQGMTFIGGWSMQSVSPDRTEAGAPRKVYMFDPDGRAIQYDFEDDESMGLPDDHLIDERRFTRLFMVDAEGWATLSEPAYYDLYTKEGDLYRYYAYPGSEHYLELCYFKSATGYEETLEDMSIEIIKVSGDILRQVRTATRLADIVIESSFKYRVDCYADADVEDMDTNGVYTVEEEAEPMVSWVFENPEPEASSLTKLRVSKISGSFTNIFDYSYEADLDDWTLVKGDGLQKTIRSSYWDDAYQKEETTELIQNELNQTVSEKVEVDEMLPFGKTRTENRVNTGDEWLITKYSYYTDPDEVGRYGSLKSKEWPDGSWETLDYDAAGRIVLEKKPYKDSAIGDSGVREIVYDYTPHVSNTTAASVDYRPRTVTEKINDIIVTKIFYVYTTNSSGDYLEVTEQALSQSASYGETNNLRTAKEYYGFGAIGYLKGRLKTVEYPDGRLDTYSYERGTYTEDNDPADCAFAATGNSGKAWRETIVHGVATNPAGVANLSTKETVVRDQYGNEVMAETYVYTGSGYERIDWVVKEFDAEGHMLEAYYSDGRQETVAWDSACCGKSSDTDAQGIERAYAYDPLGRLESVTKFNTNGTVGLTLEKVYDATGRVLEQSRSAGDLDLVVSNQYDLAGRKIKIVDPAGLITETDYQSVGRSTVNILPGGATNRTERYVDGEVRSITGSAVVEKYFDYGVNVNGSTWRKKFTASSNSPMWEKTVKDMAGRVVRIEKPAFGGGMLVTEHVYDSNGWLEKTVEHFEGSTSNILRATFYSYNSLGSRTLVALDSNENGTLDLTSDRIAENETFYQEIGNNWYRVSENRTYPEDGSSTTVTTSVKRIRLTGLGTTFDLGLLIAENISADIRGNETVAHTYIDRDNKTVTQTTDVPTSTQDVVQITINELLVQEVGGSGQVTDYTYDALERRVEQRSDSDGGSRSIAAITHYNDKNQIDWASDAASNKIIFAYDSDTGRKIAETNALGHTTLYSYNDHGQVSAVGGTSQYLVEYGYDSYGRKTDLYTMRSVASGWDRTQWVYDEATGLMTNKVYDDGHGPSYAYTPDGKPSTRTWSRDITTTYSYDFVGNLTNTVYSDSTPSVFIAYNRLGQKTQVVDASGTNTFAYSEFLQLTNEVNVGQASSLSRSYDSQGRNFSIALGNDYAVSYGYDNLGRFTSVSSLVASISSEFDYSYLPSSELLIGYTNNHGSVVSYDYETNRNVKTTVLNQFGTNLVSQFDYTYDALLRRIQRIDTIDSVVTNDFAYNVRNELIGAGMGTNVYDYAYDSIGNRTSATNNNQSITYSANALNQHIQITNNGSLVTLSYDPDGNLTNDSVNAYTWNGENRLIAVEPLLSTNGSLKCEFFYDYQGRRISKDVYQRITNNWGLITETKFLYDGWNLIHELITDNPEQITTTKSYVWGLDLSQSLRGAGGVGGLLAQITDNGATVSCHYAMADANGNFTDYVSTNGISVAHYEYNPYGGLIASSGSMADEFASRFSTKYFDAETGLSYYGFRYYSPETGRWLNRDPIGESGGLNLNGFFNNNAIDFFDKDGRFIVVVVLIVELDILLLGVMFDAYNGNVTPCPSGGSETRVDLCTGSCVLDNGCIGTCGGTITFSRNYTYEHSGFFGDCVKTYGGWSISSDDSTCE